MIRLAYYLWRLDKLTVWTLSRSWCEIPDYGKTYICWTRNSTGQGLPHLAHTLTGAVRKAYLYEKKEKRRVDI